jgi:LysM repeat protein
MENIIRLTETELINLVKNVISEQNRRKPTPEEIAKGKKTGYYTVKSGDEMLLIAKAFGVTITDIQKLNGLTNSYLNVGQKLKVVNKIY